MAWGRKRRHHIIEDMPYEYRGVEIRSGAVVHVTPDVSPETLDALGKMIDRVTENWAIGDVFPPAGGPPDQGDG